MAKNPLPPLVRRAYVVEGSGVVPHMVERSESVRVVKGEVNDAISILAWRTKLNMETSWQIGEGKADCF